MEGKTLALVVDDEKDVCFLLTSILTNKNLQVNCVHSISEARRSLIVDNPSIIFLDNHLPDGFGIDFIGEIKKIRPQIKIVMITAHDTKTDKEKAYLEGVDQFIGKPFTRENIFNAIDDLIKLKDVEL